MGSAYQKGCIMTFPLELAEVSEEEATWDYDYLLPREAALLQKNVMEACDRMEYDGSPMYDRYPDRITMERIADGICGDQKGDSLYHALAQVMLCREMGCRRDRRRCHKKRMQNNRR